MSLLNNIVRQVGQLRIASTSRSFSFTVARAEGQFGDVASILTDPSRANTHFPTATKDSIVPRGMSRNERAKVKVLDYRTKFVKPLDFARNNREPHSTRRAYLGPSAAESKKRDVFYQLGIDPLYEASNSTLLSYYVSEMGKIKRRSITGLTWKNQRRLGKAIRRAKMMGVIPILGRRPLYGYY